MQRGLRLSSGNVVEIWFDGIEISFELPGDDGTKGARVWGFTLKDLEELSNFIRATEQDKDGE